MALKFYGEADIHCIVGKRGISFCINSGELGLKYIRYALGAIAFKSDWYICVYIHLFKIVSYPWLSRKNISRASETFASSDEIMRRQTLVSKTDGNSKSFKVTFAPALIIY